MNHYSKDHHSPKNMTCFRRPSAVNHKMYLSHKTISKDMNHHNVNICFSKTITTKNVPVSPDHCIKKMYHDSQDHHKEKVPVFFKRPWPQNMFLFYKTIIKKMIPVSKDHQQGHKNVPFSQDQSYHRKCTCFTKTIITRKYTCFTSPSATKMLHVSSGPSAKIHIPVSQDHCHKEHAPFARPSVKNKPVSKDQSYKKCTISSQDHQGQRKYTFFKRPSPQNVPV